MCQADPSRDETRAPDADRARHDRRRAAPALDRPRPRPLLAAGAAHLPRLGLRPGRRLRARPGRRAPRPGHPGRRPPRRRPAPGRAAQPRPAARLRRQGEDTDRRLRDLAAFVDDLDLAGFFYRGYGPSGGTPSQDALAADAALIHDRLVARLRPPRVLAAGFSLGAG